jgi:phage terminase large subunit
MEHMRATNYDDYLWVWEGHCRTSLDGAVFADELRALRAEDRITDVPYIPGRPVQTFHDLGYADHTSIWFVQVIGFRYHFIDYYENNRKLQDHYIQVLQNRGYTYGVDWLPEDANSHTPGVRRTVKEQMQDAGRQVKIVPKLGIPVQVNAARTIFPVCVFDAVRCEKGLERLRAWRYGLNEVKGKWTRDPIHDDSSHAGSAFCSAGVALRGDTDKPKPAKQRTLGRRTGGGQGWMGV